MIIKGNFTEFKNFCLSRNVEMQYYETQDAYYLASQDGFFNFQCILEKNNNDEIEFETIYKSSSNSKIEVKDYSGRVINRFAATESGWSYLSMHIEFETSKLNSLYCKNSQGVNYNVTQKFLKSDGSECQDQNDIDSSCVVSRLIIDLDYDFEIVSGSYSQIAKPDQDLRLYVYGGAFDLGYNYCKEFVSGLNLKFIGADEQVKTDGRAAKLLKRTTQGVPVSTNIIIVDFKHPEGFKHSGMMNLEIFRQ